MWKGSGHTDLSNIPMSLIISKNAVTMAKSVDAMKVSTGLAESKGRFLTNVTRLYSKLEMVSVMGEDKGALAMSRDQAPLLSPNVISWLRPWHRFLLTDWWEYLYLLPLIILGSAVLHIPYLL